MSTRVLAVAGALLSGVVALAVPQNAPPKGVPQGGPPSATGGNELIEALKAQKGCIGVEAAFTQTRKAVIFAWFDSKKSVLDWYESDYHQTQMMGLREAAMAAEKQGQLPYAKQGEEDVEEHEPLAYVKDDIGPILCIATITPSLKQAVPGFPQSIGQISIELYAPLPGGIAFNGKFAPASLKIPHMIEMSTDAPPPANPASKSAASGQ